VKKCTHFQEYIFQFFAYNKFHSIIHISNLSKTLFTTKKWSFLETQLDWNVHFDQRVCSFWLKVCGMKNTCYIWPIHLTNVVFFTKCQLKIWSKWTNVHQNGHDGLVKLTILIWPLLKLIIMIWHLIKWLILIWWFSLLIKPRLPT